MIKNTQNISMIIMRPFADCLCAIGQDWYHIDFEVDFFPNESYPDYMDVSKYISNNISGQEMNIEDAVNVLYKYLKSTYSPAWLKVKAIVNKTTTHFPVEVVKE